MIFSLLAWQCFWVTQETMSIFGCTCIMCRCDEMTHRMLIQQTSIVIQLWLKTALQLAKTLFQFYSNCHTFCPYLCNCPQLLFQNYTVWWHNVSNFLRCIENLSVNPIYYSVWLICCVTSTLIVSRGQADPIKFLGLQFVVHLDLVFATGNFSWLIGGLYSQWTSPWRDILLYWLAQFV